jgi:hypothetical protein
MKFNLQKILRDKYVLYVTFFIALTNVIGYLGMGDYDSLIFFISVGVLSTFFSKNMTVNLIIAIAATNILFAGERIREGLKNKKKKKKKKDSDEEDKENGENGENGEEDEEDEDEKFTQKNIPSSRPAPATEGEEDEAIGKRIDYASTLEQAYDNLQNVLGPDGIKGLSKETKHLVSQQKTLMENLNGMAPVLKTAKETLDNLSTTMPDMKNLQSIMKQFGGGGGGIMKQFGGGGAKKKKRN